MLKQFVIAGNFLHKINYSFWLFLLFYDGVIPRLSILIGSINIKVTIEWMKNELMGKVLWR